MRRWILLAAGVLLVPTAAPAGPKPPKSLAWAFAAMDNPATPAAGDAGVFLLDDVSVQPLNATGKVRVESRTLFKVLSSEGTAEAFQPIYYTTKGKLEWYRAWTIRPDGAVQEVEKSRVVDHSLSSYHEFSDTRVRVLPMPDVGVGSFVAVEYALVRPQDAPDWIAHLQGRYPVARSRLVLELPDGWEHRAVFHHMAPQEPQRDGGNLVWEFENLPGLQGYQDAAPYADVTATLALSFFPREKGDAFEEWPAVASWADAQWDGVAVADEPMRRMVTELTRGRGDELAKIEAVGRYVQELRYVHISMNRSGYIPYPAPEVFSRRYGDCKDKANLMRAMLREAGIASRPLLVNTRDEGQILAAFPSPQQFNHVILAIPLAPENASRATTMLPGLGPALIFDPTDDSTPVGDLPWTDQGVRGLLVDAERGGLVDLPVLPAEANRADRRWDLRIEPDGRAVARMEAQFTGQYARLMRGWLAGRDDDERKKALAGLIAGRVAGATITDVEFRDLLEIERPVELRVDIEVPRFSRPAGPLRLVEPLSFIYTLAPALPTDPGGVPPQFSFRFRETDRVRLELPEHWTVSEPPGPVAVESHVGRLTVAARPADSGWELERDLVLDALDVPMESYEEAREFLERASRSTETRFVLERADR